VLGVAWVLGTLSPERLDDIARERGLTPALIDHDHAPEDLAALIAATISARELWWALTPKERIHALCAPGVAVDPAHSDMPPCEAD
jgi:hypothetical protein